MPIAELLSEELIRVPLQSTDKSSLLREMTEMLAEAGKITQVQPIVEALEEREALCSTGLDRGIAIPHAKTLEVEKMTLGIGITPEGIDYEALDGGLSQIFFLILTPPDQPGEHVEALSEIAKITQSAEFIQSLKEAKSPEEALTLIKEA